MHKYIYQAIGQSFGRVAVGGNGTGCTFPTVRPNPTGKGRTQCITCLPLPKVSLCILHLTELTELRQGHSRSNKAPNTGLQKSFLSLTQNTLLPNTVQMDFFLKGNSRELQAGKFQVWTSRLSTLTWNTLSLHQTNGGPPGHPKFPKV